jgi:hypothetical protein
MTCGPATQNLKLSRVSKEMPRIKVDLRKLPIWQQYAIALIVVVIVVTAAWMVGHNRPVPAWVNNYLVRFAGWFGIFAIAYLLLFGRKKKSR